MNLSDNKRRDLQQEEQIGRRSSILPERRDTRAPAYQPEANMRSARRGDGGAQALLKALGMAERAGSSLVDYAHNKHEDIENENKAQGAVDAATGDVDEERMGKSLGYRNAVTKGRTMTNFSAAMREFDVELRELTENQDDPDLDVRREEVLARMEQFYADFAQDPETGELRDFLQSPGAMRYLAEAIQTSRPEFEARAMMRIEERFNQEAVTLFQTSIKDQILDTGTLDIEQTFSLLPATVPDEARRKAFVDGLDEAANALRADGRGIEAVQLYDRVLAQVPREMEAFTAAAPEGSEGKPAVRAPASSGRVSFDKLASAVEWAESRGNQNAVSPVGAQGVMQVMPNTGKDPGYGVVPMRENTEEENRRFGRDYLKAMLREFGGDYVLALAAYNAGPGKAGEWADTLKGKSVKQKIAAIPYKETRDYVSKIMTRLGLIEGDLGAAGAVTDPEDPVQAVPEFRLRRFDVDPITEYEQTGQVEPLMGVDGLGLTAAQRSSLREKRAVLAANLKREWREDLAEEQSFNASSMALGLFGQGAMPTSIDISEAVESGAISPQHGMTLFGILRQNANAIQSYEDRQEAKRDRAEARAEKKQADAITGRYISMILSGEKTGAEARALLLEELPSITNPTVQAAAANAVLGTANDIEQLRMNSAPVRQAAREFEVLSDNAATTVAGWGVLERKAGPIVQQYSRIVDAGQAEYATRVLAGEDPEAVKVDIAKQIAADIKALETQSKPRAVPRY